MALTYKWEKSENGTTGWTAVTGGTNASLTVVTGSTTDVYYRCTVTGSNGLSTVSSVVKLDMKANVVTITSHPSSVTAHIDDTVRMTVETAVPYGSTTYKWQYKEKGETVWKDSTADTATAQTLLVTVTANTDGRQYRCIVSATAGNSTATSNVATIFTHKAPVITTQPKSTSAYPTQNAKFTIVATE